MSDSPEWPPLEEGEVLMSDPEEILWRQVNPAFVHGGTITSQAFRPTPTDKGRLSVSRSSVETAEDAYKFFTQILRRSSAGSWSVSFSEVQGAGSRAIFDAEAVTAPPPPCSPGHSSVDYRPFGSSAIKRIGAELALKADKRGRQHP